jgi:SAM-dependent methyltransferase
MRKISTPKFVYASIVYLLRKIRVYEERADKYTVSFRKFIDGKGYILDVGCGSGVFSKKFTVNGNSVIALDIQKKFLKEINEEGIYKVCADAHNLPFRESSMDYILSFSLIEHLQKPGEHIKEVHRVLKKKGKLITQVPNLQYLFEPHSKWPLLFLFPEKIQVVIFNSLNYPYVNMKVSVKKVLQLLQGENFKIIEVKKIYHLSIMKLLPFAPS